MYFLTVAVRPISGGLYYKNYWSDMHPIFAFHALRKTVMAYPASHRPHDITLIFWEKFLGIETDIFATMDIDEIPATADPDE